MQIDRRNFLMVAGPAGATISTSPSISTPAPFWERTAKELSEGVTPVNYQYEPRHLYRYGTNTTPGATDMISAFNDALSAYDVVKIPEDTILIASTLTVGDNQVLRGSGWRTTIITLSGAGTHVLLSNDWAAIENLRIDGDDTQTYGVKTGGTASRWSLRDVWISNVVSGLSLSNTWIGQLDRVQIRDCTQGIHVHNPDNEDGPVNAITINGGEIASCTYGIRFDDSGNGSFSVNAFNVYGMTIEPSGTYGVWTSNIGIRQAQFNGCHFEACGDAIYRQDTGVNVVRFVNCLLNLDTDATDKGIEVTGGVTTTLAIEYCQFNRRASSTATDAIYLGASATVNQLIIQGNRWSEAALILVNNATFAAVTAIEDQRLNTQLTGITSLASGTQDNSNNFIGKVTMTDPATTAAVTFGTAEANTSYEVFIGAPDWNAGAVWITSKATTGFTINVETARGSGSHEFYYMLTRR